MLESMLDLLLMLGGLYRPPFPLTKVRYGVDNKPQHGHDSHVLILSDLTSIVLHIHRRHKRTTPPPLTEELHPHLSTIVKLSAFVWFILVTRQMASCSTKARDFGPVSTNRGATGDL